MTGKTHFAMGAATGMLLGACLPEAQGNPAVIGGCLLCCSFGALFPDIDSPGSLLGRRCRPISTFLNKVFGHRGRDENGHFVDSAFRGFIHSPANGALLTFLLYFLFNSVGLPIFIPIAFGTGFLVHLMQDSLTKGGIPWLWPVRLKNYSFFNMKSGHWLEIPLSVVLFLFILIIVVNLGLVLDPEIALSLEVFDFSDRIKALIPGF